MSYSQMQPMILRTTKEDAFRVVKNWLPLYAQLYYELKRDGGRVAFHNRFANLRANLANFYVTLYDDERRIGAAFMIGLMGLEDFNQLKENTKSLSGEELDQLVAEFSSEETERDLLELIQIPESETKWQEFDEVFRTLSPEDQKKAQTQSYCFFSGLFAQIFNLFALMTHGATLGALVRDALAGDEEAFGKAVQVDRFLLTHHPYFVAKKALAQEEGRTQFLRNLATRECNPNLQGRIRYAPLFLLFGVLESLRWLDDLTNDEILTLCDEAGLDRYQNRIDDPMYVSKRLAEYRRYQKSGGLSMS